MSGGLKGAGVFDRRGRIDPARGRAAYLRPRPPAMGPGPDGNVVVVVVVVGGVGPGGMHAPATRTIADASGTAGKLAGGV